MGRRPMPHTLARQDEALAIVREHGILSTRDVAELMGHSMICGCTLRPRVGDWVCHACDDTGLRRVLGHEAYRLLIPMEKRGLVDGLRLPREQVMWTLGPSAPVYDLDEAALLGGT